MSREASRCPECGSLFDSNGAECPNGHHTLPLTDPINFSSADEHFGSSSWFSDSKGGPRSRATANSLFECRRCDRLVETQYHQKRVIIPRVCPWCGHPVISIVGREIDGYRIDEVLSRGGFGVIYLASNIAEPEMKAAVKIPLPEMIYH